MSLRRRVVVSRRVAVQRPEAPPASSNHTRSVLCPVFWKYSTSTAS